ncbi:hypothetical protein LTR95_013865 [Oleoguttula sp. CCFEE 5521]
MAPIRVGLIGLSASSDTTERAHNDRYAGLGQFGRQRRKERHRERPYPAFNFILHTLGELSSFDSMLGIAYPEIGIFDPKDPTKSIQRTIKTDTPDQIFLQGQLASDALLTFHMEGGEPFPGEPALRWHIVGETGELLKYSDRVQGDKSGFLSDKPQSVPVTELEVPKDALSKVRGVAENVGRLYEAFADGEEGMYADWEVGLRRHELMEEMFRRWDGEGKFGREAEYMKAGT